jgi:hypothetical protein
MRISLDPYVLFPEGEYVLSAAALDSRTRPIYADVGYYVRRLSIRQAFGDERPSVSRAEYLVRATLRRARHLGQPQFIVARNAARWCGLGARDVLADEFGHPYDVLPADEPFVEDES